MKKLIMILMLSIALFSCKKEEINITNITNEKDSLVIPKQKIRHAFFTKAYSSEKSCTLYVNGIKINYSTGLPLDTGYFNSYCMYANTGDIIKLEAPKSSYNKIDLSINLIGDDTLFALNSNSKWIFISKWSSFPNSSDLVIEYKIEN